jgi:hypothetical protein
MRFGRPDILTRAPVIFDQAGLANHAARFTIAGRSGH